MESSLSVVEKLQLMVLLLLSYQIETRSFIGGRLLFLLVFIYLLGHLFFSIFILEILNDVRPYSSCTFRVLFYVEIIS